MLPDLHAHRRKGVLFAFGLDHHVSLPTVDGGAERLPVPVVHGVCVGIGLLGWVLATTPSGLPKRSNTPATQRSSVRLRSTTSGFGLPGLMY